MSIGDKIIYLYILGVVIPVSIILTIRYYFKHKDDDK